ncbi:MAG: EF-P lysine aminoacylase GenX [Gammaproteobacteria bacterium]|nr:EF-P lysine aminoacylase GenX [Gammaproteobacteria bacterium]
MSFDNWKAVSGIENMKKRARMLQSIRAFFVERDVLEVDTPSISIAAVTDLHIESFVTEMQHQNYYLQTSPEYPMKRLLASGYPSIYQICKVYRKEEQGLFHNPEFSMLEWYRLGFDYRQLMEEVIALLELLSAESGLKTSVEKVSYQQAFIQHVDINPLHTTVEKCRQCCLKQQIEVPQGMSDDNVDEWLDWILTQAVAPAFNKKGFTILYDYPASQCALATISKDGSVAERFEVFYGELELANGFNELTDASEQRQRFENDNKKRLENGLEVLPLDENFLAALEAGLPECAGVAIGLDRLLMVLTGKAVISEVLAFPFDRV